MKTGDIEDFPGLDSIRTFPVKIDGDNVIVSAPANAFKDWKRQLPSHKCSAADKRVFVLVGAGPAGTTCAEILRSEGYTGRIVMIGKEKHLPYDRPKLSKALNTQPDKIALRSREFFTERDVELQLDREVVELDANTKTIKLDNGETIKYDAAFVATGGIPRTLPSPGFNLANIYPLRDPEHGLAIAERYEGKRVVVVGSSFIGMELASLVAKKAKSVVVVGMETVPFERVLGVDIGVTLQNLHEKNNVSFRMKRTVKEFIGVDGAVKSVLLDNGEIIDADLCVIGAGVIPATKFMKNVQIEKDSSVVADANLKAADGLYVGGDIARYPYHLAPAPTDTVRVEHWGMAHFHGKVAAQNMLGKNVKVDSVPYFWTTQYGKSLRYCGHAHSFDELYIDGSLEDLKFAGYYIKNDKVLAVISLNMDPIVSASAELLTVGKMPSGSQIKNGSIDLVKLAASQ